MPSRPPRLRQQAAKHRLGALRLTFYGVAAVTPLTIIIGAIPLGFGQLHQIATPAGYLIAAAILAVFATGLATMARHLANSGAFYSYVAAGLGKPAATAVALIALTAYTTILVGLFGAFGPAAHRTVNPAGTGTVWWTLWALAGWAVIAVLSQIKLRTNAIILGILVAAEIGYVLAIDLVLLAHPADGVIRFDAINPAPLLNPAGMASLVGAITGLIGFEVPLAFALVAINRRTTVRRAIGAILAITGLLYASTGLIMSITAGPDRIIAVAEQHPADLFFHLAAPLVPAWVIQLGTVLYATSLFAAMLAIATTIARYTLTLAREGLLPSWLAITRDDEVPVTAGIAQSAITLTALTVAGAAAVDPTMDLFFYGTTAGGLGVLICMTITAIAVVTYFHRHRDQPESWSRRRLAPLAAAVLLAAVTVPSIAVFGDLVGTTDPVKAWTPPAGYLLIAVIGIGWAHRVRTRNPTAWHAIGNGDPQQSQPQAASGTQPTEVFR
ncbi:APC family permease [Actinoplanes sp. M2I2]|uniref:APC family permease n=1 Tax=Actinoplanes sp. M2I2 TaxID=1734444 RepID=UPI00202225A8|nr:APC family permease [Actinoplanes sp. M2I2]